MITTDTDTNAEIAKLYEKCSRGHLIRMIISSQRDHQALKEENKTLASEQRGVTRQLEDQQKRAVEKINDLKTRLAAAELENARLRGYVARVQEDDVVREPLVPTGQPGGKQTLVPKRKAEPFTSPSHFTDGKQRIAGIGDRFSGFGEPAPEPVHWVTY